MNERLAASRSPYLRAHADNPVDWYPWGQEAFDEARRRGVPVLISIGYSTCHWCHVMARESFADPATADDLARDFVAIKVDREEHPEVDAAYIAAASAFTSSLGWPLTVFATPAGRAFFAGTYYPPEPRGGIPSFRQVLGAVRDAWTLRRNEVEDTARAVAAALAKADDAPEQAGGLPDAPTIAAAAHDLAHREDRVHGGIGVAGPKFPVATALRFLQTPLVREHDPHAAEVSARALRAMASSELRDPVEGGFFRYTTQPDWTVPHYERMLTDNAQLLDVATTDGNTDVAAGVAGFLVDVLQADGGGFRAAQDSESWIDGRRDEGGYYRRDAAARAELDPPAVDGKVVTGWNGLAIGALARAATRWDRPDWLAAAASAAGAVLAQNVDAARALVRASLDGVPSSAVATLADRGQFAAGLAALAAASGEVRWAVDARRLVDETLEARAERGDAASDPVLQAHGLAVAAEDSDGDEPSGAAALADACVRLWMLGAGDGYRGAAAALVARRAERALAQPLAFGALLTAAAALAVPPRQLVVVSDDPAVPVVDAARAVDADIICLVTPDQARAWAAAGFELFAAKDLVGDAAAAYDCRAFTCRLPATDPAALRASRTG